MICGLLIYRLYFRHPLSRPAKYRVCFGVQGREWAWLGMFDGVYNGTLSYCSQVRRVHTHYY